MANKIISFESLSETGAQVLVEVEDDAPGRAPVGRDEIAEKAQASFEQAAAGIRPVAEGILSHLRGLSREPESVEIKFGLKLSGELGGVIAKAAAEGHCEVTVSWTRPEPD